MSKRSFPKFASCSVIVCAALAVSGCGKSKTAEKAAPLEKFVVTSAVDCQDNANLSYDVCSDVIAKAVAAHDAGASKYTTLKACEAAEGAEKCERVDNKNFRPRLAGFVLTKSKPPVAVPVYGSRDGQVGFRGLDGSVYSSEDEAFNFTKSAVHAAELLMGEKQEESAL